MVFGSDRACGHVRLCHHNTVEGSRHAEGKGRLLLGWI